MPRRKKPAHELTTEDVLKRVFHPHVRRHLKKAAQALDREKRSGRVRKANRKP
jgi:hypothetical protein